MDSSKFIELAKSKIVFYNQVSLSKEIDLDKVYLVWYSKSLRNHKALLITSDMDGRYYEVTYNGQTDQMYVDVYKKDCNIVFENASDIEVYTSKTDYNALTELKATMFDEIYNCMGSEIDNYVDEESYIEFLQFKNN